MHQVDTEQMSEPFAACWRAAGLHLNRQVDGGIRCWLRAHPYPPFLDHLSFRLGNQLFFVRVEDVDEKVKGPGSMRGLLAVASMANGRACLLPMRRRSMGGECVADAPGWGLLDAGTFAPIDPAALVTNEQIEMSPWELHDMAVQVVREHLQSQGHALMSWQSNPDVDPSIWFVGTSRRPEWVVVRSARYPATAATRPSNWQAIAAHCAGLSTIGHFVSVGLASTDQSFESERETPIPLWRGYGMHVRFTRLE